MIDNIKKILEASENVHGYILKDVTSESKELFFVKQELDMNRAKKVHYYSVTVFNDFTEGENKFKGNSTIKLSPSMSTVEMTEKIELAALSASFVKNPHYDLVEKTNKQTQSIHSNFSDKSISDFLPELIELMFKHDCYENGGINSGEIFINKHDKRFISSTGIDVTSTSYTAQMEIVTDWTEDGEAVEIFTVLDFSEFDREMIEEEIKNAIENTKDRAIAVPMPELNNVDIILSDANVDEFFSYYPSRANVGSIFSRISDAKVGDNIQGDEILGDKVTITLVPEIKGSIRNSYIDGEGTILDDLELYADGELKTYYGSTRISQYLDVESKGIYGNTKVNPGSKTIAELKSTPYLECVFFSDFQMNSMTGDFGGEIRLARYFDGEKIIPVTGGSITGNIKDVQNEMYFSSEVATSNNFNGPKIIKLKNVSIAS